jgi:hypothetical protein
MIGSGQDYGLERICKETIVECSVLSGGTEENHKISFMAGGDFTEIRSNTSRIGDWSVTAKITRWIAFFCCCDNTKQRNLLTSFQFPEKRNSEEELTGNILVIRFRLTGQP